MWGVTLYPYILYRHERDDVSDQMFRHELEHVYQIRRDGFFKFYFTWLRDAYRFGYDNIPYEIEAYAVQHEPLTSVEELIKLLDGEV